jgi:hypothetical protein
MLACAMNYKERYGEFKKYLSSLSEDQIKKGNEIEHAKTIKEHQEFLEAYKENKCYICKLSLDTYDKSKTCIHWLLNPDGFRKDDFPLIYQKYGYTNIQSFLRWFANQDKKFRNINDLKEEMDESKIVDNTIVYNNIEWTFSCSRSDYQGHKDSFLGKTPHYHFQMRVDGKIFIRFSDFHVPLTEEDAFALEMMMDESPKIVHRFPFGEGMEDVFTKMTPEDILKHSVPTDDEKNGTFKFDTIVEAEPGKSISGEQLDEIIKESKEKNVPISSLVHKLGGKAMTIVTPGPGVPEIAHRTKRKRGKSGAS